MIKFLRDFEPADRAIIVVSLVFGPITFALCMGVVWVFIH